MMLTKLCTKLSLCQSVRTFSTSSWRCLETIISPSIDLSGEQRQLQSTAHQFALAELRPHMRDWDERQHFPRDVVTKAAHLGFGGLYASVEDGGSGLSRLEAIVVLEALAQGCVSTTAMLALHNMCVSLLSQFGSAQLKSKYLASLISFDRMASYCITEPASGSDAASLTTTALKKGDHYVLNGAKAFISGAGESELYFILCRTGGHGPKDVCTILVEKATPGLSFGKREHKLGWNSQPTRSIILEDCRVPVENLMGEEGRGFYYAMQGINGGRLNIAACSLGAAQWAMEDTLEYVNQRKQFERALIHFQNTQFTLATLATKLLAARLVLRAAAKRIDQEWSKREDDQREDDQREDDQIDNSHIPIPAMSAAGKLVAAEYCYHIIDQCLQLFGGYGYLKDFPIQQLLRDSRVHRILGGTSEIMKLVIARDFIANE